MGLTYNGEGVTLAESAAMRAAQEPYWEVQGMQSAEYRLTELDQVDPAGRYRIRVEGDVVRFQRASQAGSAGITDAALRVPWETFISIDKDGVTLDAQNQDQSFLLQVLLMYLKDVREMLEMTLESEEQVG